MHPTRRAQPTGTAVSRALHMPAGLQQTTDFRLYSNLKLEFIDRKRVKVLQSRENTTESSNRRQKETIMAEI